ncbi:MAG: immunity 17 family protein, partial [Planctomycetota bacterium]
NRTNFADGRAREMKEPWALMLVLVGLFAIAGGLFDWEWFMTNRKAWVFVKLFGRNGARIFYCILGLAVAVLGVLIAFGIVT